MVRIFNHYVPSVALWLALLETLLFVTVCITAELMVPAGVHGDRPALWEAFLVAAAIVVVLSSVGLYNRDIMAQMRSVLPRAVVGLLLVSGLFLTSLMIVGALQGRKVQPNPQVVIAVPVCVAVAILMHGMTCRILGSERFRRRVLVIGNGSVAAKVATMSEAGHRNFDVIAFVDCGNEDAVRSLRPTVKLGSLMDRGEMLEFVRRHKVDKIVVATRERRGLPVPALLGPRLQGIAIQEFASFFESETGQFDLDELHPSWLIYGDGFCMDRGRMIVKALFDYFFASLLLIVTLPITVLTALLIKLTSPGPVFFQQERVGLNGKVFHVLKFRSMRADAEKAGPQWAKVNDDRVTLIGRFIRKTRIDEIPQAINILRGEMSFIGPRPERPVFVGKLRDAIPYFDERHQIKPGITGWAQVNYPYGASLQDARNKLSFDLYYLKNGSFFLDLVILAQTVRVVLWSAGAR